MHPSTAGIYSHIQVIDLSAYKLAYNDRRPRGEGDYNYTRTYVRILSMIISMLDQKSLAMLYRLMRLDAAGIVAWTKHLHKKEFKNACNIV